MRKYILIVIVIFISFHDMFSQTFKDERDGSEYKMVKIGNQTWMAQNLCYKTSSGCWQNPHTDKYGYYYNWQTAKKVCPVGWHLPNKAEYEELLNYYKGDGKAAFKALEENGESGFLALFAGSRMDGNVFPFVMESALFWVNEPTSSDVWVFGLHDYYKKAYLSTCDIEVGLSVRCVLGAPE